MAEFNIPRPAVVEGTVNSTKVQYEKYMEDISVLMNDGKFMANNRLTEKEAVGYSNFPVYQLSMLGFMNPDVQDAVKETLRNHGWMSVITQVDERAGVVTIVLYARDVLLDG